MTPLVGDEFPPETDAKGFYGAFHGRKEFAPQDYNLDAIASFCSIEHLVGKQVTTYLIGGYQANGEVICTVNLEEKPLYLVLRSYENDLVRYYYVNPTSITCLSFVDRERKTIKNPSQEVHSGQFLSNQDPGDEAYQPEAHPI